MGDIALAADVELDDLLEMAGFYFRDAMRQVDIEAFFSRHDVPLAEGSSKKTYATNTLASLPSKKALVLILAFAKEKQEIALQDCVYQLQDKATPEITKITCLRVADLLGTGIHGQGVDPDAITAMFDLEPHTIDFIFTKRTKIDDLWQYATGPDPEWNAKMVFEFVGAMNCPSQRFLELLRPLSISYIELRKSRLNWQRTFPGYCITMGTRLLRQEISRGGPPIQWFLSAAVWTVDQRI